MELEFHQLDRRWEHLRVRQPGRQRRLIASLACCGQQTPIVVAAIADQPDRYVVIDGYKRLAALDKLGHDTVEAVVWPLAVTEALVLDRSIQMSARLTALEEGWLLAELEESLGYGPDELARRFDRSTGWVMRRLALVERLPKRVQQQVCEGKITAHVATKYLSPVAEVSLEDCQRMADGFARHRFNTRQASQVYAAWRDGGAVIRQRILEQPQLFLKARRQAESPVPATPAEELQRDLDIVVTRVERASRMAGRAALEMNCRQRERARRQINRALEQLNRLARTLAGEEAPLEEDDVEQKSADGDFGTGGTGRESSPDRTGNENLEANGAQRDWFKLIGGANAGAAREGRALPPADPGTVAEVQRESSPGP